MGDDPDEDVAAIMYSTLFVLISIFYVLLWWYASSHDRLLGRNVDRREVDAITRQFTIGPVLYVVALIMAILAVVIQSEMLTGLSVLLDLQWRSFTPCRPACSNPRTSQAPAESTAYRSISTSQGE